MKFGKFICRFMLMLLVGVTFAVGNANAQKVAVKTNLLYAATTSPNAAIEMRMSDKTTLELGGGMSLWKFGEKTTWKHWMVQPEVRYWFCDVFNGHFVGFHAHGGQFNVGGLNIPVGRLSELKDHRYQGYFYGAGMSYGYQWILSRHWNMEVSLGAGYARVMYEKFPCAHCGTKQSEGAYNYWGVTRGTLSLIYVF